MAEAQVAKASLANGEKVSFSYGSTDLSHLLRSIPDIAENAEQVETTVLKSTSKTYINGLKDYGELEFGFIYDKETAVAIKALKDAVQDISVTLSDGTKITFKAQLSLSINAVSSGALMEMTIKCALQSDITIA